MAAFIPKVAQWRLITNQTRDYTSVSASTAAFGTETYTIRIAATSSVHFRIYDAATSSTCTSADPILPAGIYEYVGVTPGQRLSVINANIPTSADGRMIVSEIC